MYTDQLTADGGILKKKKKKFSINFLEINKIWVQHRLTFFTISFAVTSLVKNFVLPHSHNIWYGCKDIYSYVTTQLLSKMFSNIFSG